MVDDRENEEEYSEAYIQEMQAEYNREKSTEPHENEQFTKWIYANKRICNGDDLIEAWENPVLYEHFLSDTRS